MIMAVERLAWVTIDLERLIEHARDAGVEMNKRDAELLLEMWGFTSCGGDQWLGNERALMCLRDDEIREKRVWEA